MSPLLVALESPVGVLFHEDFWASAPDPLSQNLEMGPGICLCKEVTPNDADLVLMSLF